MEKITYKNILPALKSKMVLAIAGGLVLASCTTQMGSYTETDGVYYDPNRDTLPEGTMTRGGNHVGEYYDYQANDDANAYLNVDNRNQRWRESQNSDWGSYQGTDTYYTDNWGYHPYGYGGFGFGMSFGWGSPWGYGSFYNPWGFGYSPWNNYYSPYYGYYNPYFGYNSYYGYGGYGYGIPYGYGSGYNSYNGGFTNKRSGRTGSIGNSFQNSGNSLRTNGSSDSRFRNNSTRTYQNGNNNGFRQQNSTQQPRLRNVQPTSPRQSQQRQTMPTYNEPRFRGNSNDGGGFRSGGSSGGFNSGSSSSGSTRSSGGFRR